MNCIIYVDGGARGNPGPAGVGVVIQDAADGQALQEVGYYLGHATNNVAEYTGLIRALELADQLGARGLTIRSDSQLMVRQLLGEYRVKAEGLKPLFQRARELLDGFDSWSIDHVPREKNQVADRLANQAMDAKRDVAS